MSNTPFLFVVRSVVRAAEAYNTSFDLARGLLYA